MGQVHPGNQAGGGVRLVKRGQAVPVIAKALGVPMQTRATGASA